MNRPAVVLAVLVAGIPPAQGEGADGLAAANRRLRQAEAELQALRDQQVDNLARLAALETGAEDRAEVRVASARVRIESASAAEDVGDTYLDDLGDAPDDEARAAVEKAMGESRASAADHRRLAIAELRDTVEATPTAGTTVEARHLLAEALAAEGEERGAQRQRRKLVQTAPGSPEGRRAALLLGDRALGAGRVRDAEKLLRIAAGPKPERGGDAVNHAARHKLSWCRVRRKDRGGALKILEKLLGDLQRVEGGSPLRPQVLGDYLYVLAAGSGYRAAVKRLKKRWGKAAVGGYLPGLARAWRRERRWADALAAHRAVIHGASAPAREAGHRWRVVECLAGMGKDGAALDAADDAFRVLARLRDERTPEAAQARALAEAQARRLLLRRHDDLLKTSPGKKKAEREARLLAAWLEAFPKAEAAPAMRLALADVLHWLGRHGQAADAFDAVFADPAAGDLRADGARGVVLSLAEVLRAGGDATDAARAAGVGRRLVERADSYLETSGGSEEALVVRLERAEALRRLGDREGALAGFASVVAEGGDLAVEAADATLQVHVEAEQWGALATAAAAFRDQEGLGDRRFRARMETVRCRAAYRAATGASPATEAGRRLRAFADDNGGCTEAPAALVDAARRHAERGLLVDARAALLALTERYPKAPEGQDADRLVVDVCERLGDLRCAAAALTRLAAAAKCPEREALSLRAAELEVGAGMDAEALKRWKALRQACRKQDGAPIAVFDAGRDAMVRGDAARATALLKAWRSMKHRDPDRKLAWQLHMEAAALAGGKTDSIDLEGLLAEYSGSPDRGAESATAAAAAVAALVESLRLRGEQVATRAEGGEMEHLAALADLVAALERWAGTAATSEDPALRGRALVAAARGLNRAAAALEVAGRRVPALAGEAGPLATSLRERATGLARQAREGDRAIGAHRLQATLLAGPAWAQPLWDELSPMLGVGPGGGR